MTDVEQTVEFSLNNCFDKDPLICARDSRIGPRPLASGTTSLKQIARSISNQLFNRTQYRTERC